MSICNNEINGTDLIRYWDKWKCYSFFNALKWKEIGILYVNKFTSSQEKIACPFTILCVIMKVFFLCGVDEKYFQVGPFTYAVIKFKRSYNSNLCIWKHLAKMSDFISSEKMCRVKRQFKVNFILICVHIGRVQRKFYTQGKVSI